MLEDNDIFLFNIFGPLQGPYSSCTIDFLDSVLFLFLFSYEKPAKHVTHPRVILESSHIYDFSLSEDLRLEVPGFALYIL